MTQLAFDFELDPEPVTDTAFPEMQVSGDGGKCSRCLKPLKGRYGNCHGALRPEGWYAWCDKCSTEKRTA